MGMTTTTPETASSLQDRARRLRLQAAALPPLLADTYRRRAAEIDLQAWLESVWNPPMDLELIVNPRAA
jgi:hypothetical protein